MTQAHSEDEMKPISVPLEYAAGNGDGRPGFKGTLKKINVLLGANGSGKSKILSHFRDNIHNELKDHNVVFVEGGRALSVPASVKPSQKTYDSHFTLAKSEETYGSKKKKKITDRVIDAFILLNIKDGEVVKKHSDAAVEWQEQNLHRDKFPKRELLPLRQLFAGFNQIFPDITITLEPETANIRCTKLQSTSYGPEGLSDGEKQILCLLADIGHLAGKNSIIIVDEPELNLNPQLACLAWEVIESMIPGGMFIYGTHCLSFAMRKGVDAVFVIDKNQTRATEVAGLKNEEEEVLRPFLGAIPAILSAQKVLAVEGHDKSFDSAFYNLLTDGAAVEVIPLGSCSEVTAAVEKTGIWENIAPTVSLRGIIDSDFNEPKLAVQNVVALSFHEAESYLCHPSLLTKLSKACFGSSMSEAALTDAIVSFCRSKVLEVAIKRTLPHFSGTYSLGMMRRTFSKFCTAEQYKGGIKAVSENAAKIVSDSLNPSKAIAKFDDEVKNCNAALDAKDIPKILRIFPGKELLRSLLSSCGFSDELSLLRAFKTHMHVRDFQHLTELKENISNLFKATGV